MRCLDCPTDFEPRSPRHQFCSDACRGRWHNRGRKPRSSSRNQGTACGVCSEPATCKGYCGSHYDQIRRRGTTEPYVRPPLREIKQCPRCGEDKHRSEFYTRRNGSGQRALCRWASLARKFGITKDSFEAMVAKQGGTCGICHKETTTFDVDHCHETGIVRGLLCRRCNLLLGSVADDTAVLQNAIDYLEGDYALQC